MILKIHILETDRFHDIDDEIETNCGLKLPFQPVAADFGDGRICNDCLAIHRKIMLKGKTFGILEKI